MKQRYNIMLNPAIVLTLVKNFGIGVLVGATAEGVVELHDVNSEYDMNATYQSIASDIESSNLVTAYLDNGNHLIFTATNE